MMFVADSPDAARTSGPRGVAPRRPGYPVAALASLGPLLLALLGLAAWATGALRLASLSADYIPMAPSTAVGFATISIALIALSLRATAATRKGSAVAAAALALLAAVKLVEFFTGAVLLNVEAVLVARPGAFGLVPLARMSPLTAVGFLLSGLALASLTGASTRRAVDAGAVLGAIVALAGAIVVLGYMYRAPLLYGGAVIPMALTTGLAFVGIGVALVANAGTGSAVLGPFRGSSARARLLRIFLPLTVVATLLNGILTNVILAHIAANPALLAATFALVSALAVGAAVSWVAGALGGDIDRAHVVLEQSREELERRVDERTTELVALNRELESFSYSVSHDLRAPLRHVLGFTAMLQRESGERLDDRGRQHLTKVDQAARRMSALIDDLLELARHTRIVMCKQRVDLASLIRDAQSELATQTSGRQIAWRIEDALPELLVDPGLFRLVLVNLLSNAIKYTARQAEAEIEVGIAASGNNEVVLFVRDNGVGFDMAQARNLFGVFQRFHAASDFEGTGVGLANVSRIVGRHGGRVWADAAVGKGATFYVALPS